MTAVSVIIPVYNTEKYLRRCLDSVCNQTLKDIEIICINDCSPDNSLEILKEYAEHDNRIKIINFEQNKGVAVARNTGIEQAIGEYIGFVDSDDFIDLDFYEKLFCEAQKTDSNLVVANFRIETEDGIEYHDIEQTKIFTKITENSLYFNGLFTLGLYRVNLIRDNSIKFIENCVYGEDRLLPLAASYYAKKIKTVNDVFYHYVRNVCSVTKRKKNEKILDSFIFSLKKILDFINVVEMSSHDYVLVCDVFLKNSLGFFIELEDNLRIKFYNDFRKDIFILLNEDKLLDDILYSELKICFNTDKLSKFDIFVKKYTNKAIFNCIREKRKKNNQPKVSIIVPVYNAEDFLDRCLQSLIGQTLKDIEIICIDDCSSDNSLNILEEYAQKDSHIRVIHNLQNIGEGATRNKGICQAQGEYIGFVDADDSVDLDFFEKLYEKAISQDYDLAKAKLVQISYDGKFIQSNHGSIIKVHPLCVTDEFTSLIYKRKFFTDNKIFFPEDVPLGEDILFLNKIVLKAKNICFVDDVRYNYFRRVDSMNSLYLTDEKIRSGIFVFNSIIENINRDFIIRTKEDSCIYQKVVNDVFFNFLNMIFKTTDVDMRYLSVENIINFWNKIKEKDYLIKNLKSFGIYSLFQNVDVKFVFEKIKDAKDWKSFLMKLLREKVGKFQ